MNLMLKKQQTYIIIGALLAVLLFVVIAPSENVASERPAVLGEEVVVPIKFPDVTLEANGAVVYDPKNDSVIFSKNADTQLPLASVTKVMTSVVVMEQLPEDYEIIISSAALEADGESGLELEDKWEKDELVKYMLMVSSNDAAEALALSVESLKGQSFIDLMNQKAQRLGLTQTLFYSPSGLDKSYSLPGAYGSATDIAKLILYAWQNYPDIWAVTIKSEANFKTLNGRTIKAENTNQSSIHTTLIRASKTGFTPLAGGNLAVVFEAGPARPMAVVILGSSELGRFRDVETLISLTLEYLAN